METSGERGVVSQIESLNDEVSLALKIPALEPGAYILLLLGRVILSVHKLMQPINGPHNSPFAQKYTLDLGIAHKPIVHSFKTSVLLKNWKSIITHSIQQLHHLKGNQPQSIEDHKREANRQLSLSTRCLAFVL